jgi:hypothetical protein
MAIAHMGGFRVADVTEAHPVLRHSAAIRTSRGPSLDHDLPHRSGPIVVAAPQVISPDLRCLKIQVLLLVRLHDDFSAIGAHHFRVSDGDRLEKLGRGELVRLDTEIFETQPVGDAALKS